MSECQRESARATAEIGPVRGGCEVAEIGGVDEGEGFAVCHGGEATKLGIEGRTAVQVSDTTMFNQGSAAGPLPFL